MKTPDYYPRVADQLLVNRLGYAGAVLIEGARGCGKTETARQLGASELLLDVDRSSRELLELGVSDPLQAEAPLLIDEWQLVPSVWNLVRREVDARKVPGQFILTGSAKPADDITRHSGARRFSRIRMRPMSLYEMGFSDGFFSLHALLSGAQHVTPHASPIESVVDLADMLCRGGWPTSLNVPEEVALEQNRDYIEELVHSEINTIDGSTRNSSDKVKQALEALARHTSAAASLKTLIEDMREFSADEASLSPATLSSYMSKLETLMILEPLYAWAPKMRSKVGLRQRAHQHFVDPCLAVAAMRRGPSDLLNDFSTFGLLFESLVIRDLRVYADLHRGEVRFFGNFDDDEIDAIVDFGNGQWGAFEIKLSNIERKIDEAAKNLTRIIAKIDTSKVGQPAITAIITGTGIAKTRDDGISIIPIGCLRP
jgi:predicted AAA+ superfamily ATPase